MVPLYFRGSPNEALKPRNPLEIPFSPPPKAENKKQKQEYIKANTLLNTNKQTLLLNQLVFKIKPPITSQLLQNFWYLTTRLTKPKTRHCTKQVVISLYMRISLDAFPSSMLLVTFTPWQGQRLSGESKLHVEALCSGLMKGLVMKTGSAVRWESGTKRETIF